LTDPSMRLHPSEGRPALRLATRADIEEYEHSSVGGRRRRTAGLVVALGTALVALGALFFVSRGGQAPPIAERGLEREPNDTRAEAEPLPQDVSRFGNIGRRLDRQRGDVDVYALGPFAEGVVSLRAELGPLPNVDLVLEALG